MTALLPLMMIALTASPDCDVGNTAALRDARAGFNAAIAGRNPAGVAAVLADDVVLVTGSDSVVFRGREAQVTLWREEFASPDYTPYVRTPTCVAVSPLLPIALEEGTWRGVRDADPASFAAGRYSAKWRLDPDGWRLEVEVFMTERCGGDFCPES